MERIKTIIYKNNAKIDVSKYKYIHTTNGTVLNCEKIFKKLYLLNLKNSNRSKALIFHNNEHYGQCETTEYVSLVFDQIVAWKV
ncbi:hypothetical protein J7J62_02295 [bacterium]|nr:hypothetical protein [bacterium]